MNAIRAFPGRGVLLYGARTLSSDPAFRYVNVRRLLMMIERALRHVTQWAVFECNDFGTRQKLRLAIESFLETIWRRGMLAGARPWEAFQVKCDESNNPSEERYDGRLLAEIAVAPSVPSEFVIIRLRRAAESQDFNVE